MAHDREFEVPFADRHAAGVALAGVLEDHPERAVGPGPEHVAGAHLKPLDRRELPAVPKEKCAAVRAAVVVAVTRQGPVQATLALPDGACGP